ncbi:hypothetical protein HDU76_003118 [Blyttiomyces sp. JEL0837]|nr:hypothetical protein HDU76_003118 [Blyttiomyces sp. JEL0837]
MSMKENIGVGKTSMAGSSKGNGTGRWKKDEWRREEAKCREKLALPCVVPPAEGPPSWSLLDDVVVENAHVYEKLLKYPVETVSWDMTMITKCDRPGFNHASPSSSDVADAQKHFDKLKPLLDRISVKPVIPEEGKLANWTLQTDPNAKGPDITEPPFVDITLSYFKTRHQRTLTVSETSMSMISDQFRNNDNTLGTTSEIDIERMTENDDDKGVGSDVDIMDDDEGQKMDDLATTGTFSGADLLKEVYDEELVPLLDKYLALAQKAAELNLLPQPPPVAAKKSVDGGPKNAKPTKSSAGDSMGRVGGTATTKAKAPSKNGMSGNVNSDPGVARKRKAKTDGMDEDGFGFMSIPPLPPEVWAIILRFSASSIQSSALQTPITTIIYNETWNSAIFKANIIRQFHSEPQEQLLKAIEFVARYSGADRVLARLAKDGILSLRYSPRALERLLMVPSFEKPLIVRALLDAGYRVTPPILYRACRLGELAVLRVMMGYVAGREAENSLLPTACIYGRLDIVKYLVEERKMPLKGARFVDALNQAAKHDHLEIVKCLMGNCDGVRIRLSSVMVSAASNGAMKVVRYMHEVMDVPLHFESQNNGTTDAKTQDKSTFLCACEHNQVHVVRYCIIQGVSPRVSRSDGRTGLHLCTDGGVAKILVDAGADVNASDGEGKIPLRDIVTRVKDKSKRMEIALILLNAQSNVNSAVADFTKIFVDHGVDPEEFLEAGADLKAKIESNFSPGYLGDPNVQITGLAAEF